MNDESITESEKKWNDLETLILQNKDIEPILEYIKVKRPDDWITGYNDKYLFEFVITAKISGYTDIKIIFNYNKMTSKWNQHKFYSTNCLVCGRLRADNLEEILALAWHHYTHL